MRRLVALLCCLCCAGPSGADVRPFQPGSLRQIEAEHAGRPFILALWSATCTHCPGELKALGELVRRHKKLAIVLVATDTPDDAPALARLAADHGLDGQPQWVFADPQAERLRYEIDPRWTGELPRTYFFDSKHRRTGRSGIIPPADLARWVQEHDAGKF